MSAAKPGGLICLISLLLCMAIAVHMVAAGKPWIELQPV